MVINTNETSISAFGRCVITIYEKSAKGALDGDEENYSICKRIREHGINL